VFIKDKAIVASKVGGVERVMYFGRKLQSDGRGFEER